MTSARPPGDDDQVYRISAAGRSLSDDIDTRTRRYLISMGIRTLCFIGCVLAFTVLKQPVLGWILLAGALVLPYVAVVVANAGPQRTRQIPRTTLRGGSGELPTGPEGTGPTSNT